MGNISCCTSIKPDDSVSVIIKRVTEDEELHILLGEIGTDITTNSTKISELIIEIIRLGKKDPKDLKQSDLEPIVRKAIEIKIDVGQSKKEKIPKLIIKLIELVYNTPLTSADNANLTSMIQTLILM